MRFYSKNLWNPLRGTLCEGSFEVVRGRFRDFRWGKPEGAVARSQIKDFGAHWILPSAVDLHVHSRDFEESHKETFESLDAQAAMGGVSVAACMANTQPRLDAVDRVKTFLKRSSKLNLRLIPFAAVTKNLEGKEATAWAELLKLPIAGLSDDGKPLLDEGLMRAVVRAVKKSQKILSLHEEDTELSKGSVIHLSDSSRRLGLEGSPAESEWSMVKRDLAIAKAIGGHLHFGHLSSAKSVDLLRQARRAGISFSAELTPHHGLLTVEDYEALPPACWHLMKVCPCIRDASDRAALWRGLKEGILDCLASDHAPHSDFEKQRPLLEAMHGIISLQYHLPLYNEVRLESKLSVAHFVRALSQRPAALLGVSQDYGDLRDGLKAHFVVFDPLTPQRLRFDRSRSQNSPFEGKVVRGRVVEHWREGHRLAHFHTSSD